MAALILPSMWDRRTFSESVGLNLSVKLFHKSQIEDINICCSYIFGLMYC